jgi:ATP-binding cassette subfamily B protein
MQPTEAAATADAGGLTRFFGVFRYGRRAIELVWQTNPALTIGFALLTAIAGVLPAAIAYVGQLIVDAVVALVRDAPGTEVNDALRLVAIEAAIVAVLAVAQRGISTCQSLLRVQLGHRVNTMILEKALTLRLRDFEDSEFYDKLTRARREASSRPLSLVNRTFGLVQNLLALTSFAALLWQFSPWTLVILAVAGIPAFIAEAKFSGDAFRLFRWRSPQTRRQMYIEMVLAREDFAKEVQLYGLGDLMLERYREIFRELYREDRSLTLRRDFWGTVLGLVATAAFYGAYAWIVLATVAERITLGQMTMYLALFKQGQSSVASILGAVGGMYEDNLYLSNLYEYLEQDVPADLGSLTEGPSPGDGIRFENVSFTYPGASRPAVDDVSFHIRPGESLALVGENGSGKTTLIKLLTRLYDPDSGAILLDGLDLREWQRDVLRQRIAVIFQDFARYQMLLGENIGAGDTRRFGDAERWREAARQGTASAFIAGMPLGYETQLGRWFKDGQELSGGQWQKIALSRAFMREDADILVLDEPTAAMDAAAEAQVFEHVGKTRAGRIAILISHRFSTVRIADQILVLGNGRIIESGSHQELLDRGGHYASLFELQAAGYR